ncbi:hypothetical protein C5167_014821 [Papaver somniferum]|uniref:Uncharacterized protein n=1 Tax=Papaver somniferum TaxID=3469 RepID=A0A4Y7J7S1_PAPSO|nr:hypothetical protein C5167_014821 [Papaver somniferum]
MRIEAILGAMSLKIENLNESLSNGEFKKRSAFGRFTSQGKGNIVLLNFSTAQEESSLHDSSRVIFALSIIRDNGGKK